MTPVELLPLWLARTKLRPPLPRADLLGRERLLARLRAAVAAHPLTLISAPAGSGKTTLVTQWVAGVAGELQVGWLSLDEQDDDPAVFLAGLLAALRSVCPACGQGLAALHSAEGPADLRPLVGPLVNALDEHLTGPAALVLDDLHLITSPAILQALELLVGRLPPRLRLVLIARADPPLGLPRLRARRQLAELRLPDLRFTLDEAGGLLNSGLALGLDPDEVRAAHSRTEGWAAGLSLLASSLELAGSPAVSEADAKRLRSRLMRGVGRTERAIFDYLAEEVLERQDPFARMFLLETAILPELTPEACAAVTGRDDAAAVLDELYRRNLFLVALDDAAAGAAYRYHDLFADFLRERLRREHPGWLRDLHRRAAAAAGPAGRAQHLVQAGLWDEAAAAIDAVGDELLARGAFVTLRQQVEALPAEARAARPELTALYGLALHYGWQLEAALPWLTRATRELEAAGSTRRLGEALACLSDTQRMLGQYEAASRSTRAALGHSMAPGRRAHLLLSTAWQSLAEGDWPAAREGIGAALDLLEGGATEVVYRIVEGYHSPFASGPGGVALAERYARLLAAHPDGGHGPLLTSRLTAAAWCALLRGRIAEGVALAGQALAAARRFGRLSWVEGDVGAVPWLVAGIAGDVAAARAGRDALLALTRAEPSAVGFRAWEPLYRLLAARAVWLHGDAAALRAEVAAAEAAARPDEWPIGPALRGALRAMLAIAEGDYPAAEPLLLSARDEQARHPEGRLATDARVLLAHLYRAWGRTDQALAALGLLLDELGADDTPGLLLLEGEPVARPLLELAVARGVGAPVATRALALLEAQSVERKAQSEGGAEGSEAPALRSNAQTQRLAEPLTAREGEILRMLAAGASNQAIADALVISLHTVKRHVTNLHQKLGVASRLEAVARARELGMV